MPTDYYAAVRSGSPIAETTVCRDRECERLADADVTPRPITETLVDSTDPERCEACVGNSNDSDSGGDGETCQTVKSDGEVCGRERPCPYHD